MERRKVLNQWLDKALLRRNDNFTGSSVRIFWFFSLLIPIGLIIAVYLGISFFIMEREIADLSLRSLGQVRSNLQYRFESVASTAISMITSMQPYLKNVENDNISQQLDEYNEITNLISIYNDSMVHNVRLYVDPRKMYSGQRHIIYPLSDLKNLDSMMEYTEKGNRIFWLETYETIGTDFRPVEKNVSCAALLIDSEDFTNILGIVFMDISESRISEILDIGINPDESVYLVNSAGLILSHKNQVMIGSEGLSADEIREMSKSERGTIRQNGEILAYESLSYPNWYLIARIPTEVIGQSGKLPLYTISLVAMVLIVMLVIFTIYQLFVNIIEKMVYRVNQVIIHLKRDGINQLSDQYVQSRDVLSITSLEQNVENLVGEINSLLEESYKSKLSQKEADLRVLQAQINPHFLYNTLDNIQWMIMDGDKEQSLWMIKALSRYFRLSLNKGKDVVRLQDEYDLAMTYLGIQQKRFSGLFTVSTEVDDRAMVYLIPKLSLQPIVENAVVHGLRNKKDGSGHIHISIVLIDSDIEISIMDNGKGIENLELDAIKHFNTGGFGLKNVDERIKLLCGKEYGISIDALPNQYTKVTIRLRAIDEASNQ